MVSSVMKVKILNLDRRTVTSFFDINDSRESQIWKSGLQKIIGAPI